MSNGKDKGAAHAPEVWNQAERFRSDNATLAAKNRQLEEEVERLRGAGIGIGTLDMEEGGGFMKKSRLERFCGRHSKLLKFVFICIPLVLLVIAACFIIGLYVGDMANRKEEPARGALGLLSSLPIKSKRLQLGGEGALNYNKHYLNIGERRDFLLQECHGPELKRSFPDLDYALKGYNILKGYPLAVGHDPGFSLPIFIADYTDSGQTADCRYSVPRGLIVTPDVSCVVSFTSKVIQTRYEFSKSLSVSAQASGGGWGVSFSASAGYKMASSAISTGEYSYILSTASCRYYYAEILPNMPPPLHPAFVDWVHRLDAAPDNAEDLYAQFFEKYGTHFAPEVIFGARYTHEHKMESKKLESMTQSGVNVAVSASYSGLFSAGGAFSLDSSQREAASNFQKNVESKTITIGAPPPATGDAQAWASTVKEDPVPVDFKLTSIEELFNGYYMNGLGVNYTRISNNIRKLKGVYCKYMMDKGEVDSCQALQPGLEMRNTRLFGHYRSLVADKATCIEECNAEVKCVAITKCLTCKDNFAKRQCYLLNEPETKDAGYRLSTVAEGWESTIFLPKIYTRFPLSNTAIEGIERGEVKNSTQRVGSVLDCWQRCFGDEQCAAFSYCDCPSRANNCRLFAERSITGMMKEMDTTTFYISRLQSPSSNYTKTN